MYHPSGAMSALLRTTPFNLNLRKPQHKPTFFLYKKKKKPSPHEDAFLSTYTYTCVAVDNSQQNKMLEHP